MKKSLSNIFTLILVLLITTASIYGGTPKVKLGNEVLLEKHLNLIKGKKVGLVTNPTGVNSQLISLVDILNDHPDIALTALFGPEHGVRGNVDAGGKVDDFVDEKTGIPVYSLYGKNKKPSQEMLENVDVLLYDIQDIGSRAYTYIYTMARSMQSAAENKIPYIVLDRPNPLGGKLVEGPILEPEYKSGVGLYPIPFIYGLTCGELAMYFNEEFDINCDLTVIPMEGWTRDMLYDETGLFWIPTSPHIPHAEASVFCACTGIIGELHKIDIGIGYTLPFELIGQTWIDGQAFADNLNARQLDGVYFRSMYYTPYYFHQEKQHLSGVQLHITDYETFLPIRTMLHILDAIHDLYPEQNLFDTKRVNSFQRASGTDKIRQAVEKGTAPDKQIKSWQKDVDKFTKKSKKYYLYN